MFLGSSGKAYSKETPQQEFVRYIRDTGTAKALEQAMITLFKMPIKPTNIKEYFAEYLGNGAQQLIRLSLLKAELCYKHSETQDMHKSIQRLEQQIQTLEPESEIFEKNSPSVYFDGDKNAYSLMERFLADLDDASRGSVGTTAAPSVIVSVVHNEQDIPEENEEMHSDDTGSGYFEEEEAVTEFEESPEGECIREEDSILAFQRDIKSLDPWGIVFGFQSIGKDQKKSRVPSKGFETMSLIDSEPMSEGEKTFQNCDSDDAETLAEMYQHLAMDISSHYPKTSNDPTTRLNDTDVKLLSVRKAPKLSMADLLGWSSGPSTTRFHQGPSQPQTDTAAYGYDPLTSNRNEAPLHWYELISNRNGQESDMDLSYASRGQETVTEKVSQDQDNPEGLTTNEMDDSFLLEDDMRRISNKLHKAWSDESCVFDFATGYTSEIEEACAETCRRCLKSAKSVRANITKDQGTMTIDLEKCGEDCGEDRRGSRFGLQIPGKMSNWTKDYECSPGEDYDLLGEDENIKCFKRKSKKSQDPKSKKSSIEQTVMKDLALAPPPETQCKCSNLSATASLTMSDCMQTCGDQAIKDSMRKSKDEETMTLTDQQMKKQETGLKKTSLSDGTGDLAEVFKSRRSYPSQDQEAEEEAKEKQRKSRKSSFDEDNDEKRPFLGNAYQVDLGKEVKRRFQI